MYSFNGLFQSSVAHLTERNTVSPVQVMLKVDGDLDLLLHREMEEAIRNSQLTEDLLIGDPMSSHNPESDITHRVLQLLRKPLLLTWFIKPRHINLHQRRPVQLLLRLRGTLVRRHSPSRLTFRGGYN
jgi:hypothetical protein